MFLSSTIYDFTKLRQFFKDLVSNGQFKMTAILSVINKYIRIAFDQGKMIYQTVSSNQAILELNGNKYTTINNFLQSRVVGFNQTHFSDFWKNHNEKKKRALQYKSTKRYYKSSSNNNNNNNNMKQENRFQEMIKKYKNIAIPLGLKGNLPSGVCGFYNTRMGCSGPPKCRFAHICGLCGKPHTIIECAHNQIQQNNNN